MRNIRETDGRYLLGSLRKGLSIIDRFTERDSWSLAELVAALSQSKTTVFRMLHTLELCGYLERDSAAGRYTIGPRFRAIGGAAQRQEQLRWQSLAPLQDLATETGETAHVAVLYDGEAVCVQAVDGTRLVRMHAFVGKRTPAHASALGKVLLAHLPAKELASIVARRGLRQFTPATLTDPAALRSALANVRANGWAFDAEEMEVGLRCLGAPIMGPDGRPCASIAVSAPAARMDAARVTALVPRLQSAAERIGHMLGAPAGVRAA